MILATVSSQQNACNIMVDWKWVLALKIEYIFKSMNCDKPCKRITINTVFMSHSGVPMKEQRNKKQPDTRQQLTRINCVLFCSLLKVKFAFKSECGSLASKKLEYDWEIYTSTLLQLVFPVDFNNCCLNGIDFVYLMQLLLAQGGYSRVLTWIFMEENCWPMSEGIGIL